MIVVTELLLMSTRCSWFEESAKIFLSQNLNFEQISSIWFSVRNYYTVVGILKCIYSFFNQVNLICKGVNLICERINLNF